MPFPHLRRLTAAQGAAAASAAFVIMQKKRFKCEGKGGMMLHSAQDLVKKKNRCVDVTP